MLNVMIIDDEKLVRAMIRQCINWEEINLEVVGEASSARMGMELIEEVHPDIIVMDIKMPGMNGLVCSELILGKYPHIKIIILSGHDDFEYATEGIHIGVFEYLLKPVNEEELRKAVIKARDAVYEERNHQKEFDRYKDELEKHSSYIKDRQLWGLISSSSPRQYLESLDYFGIKIKDHVFQVALIEPRFQENCPEEEKILMKMLVRKLVEDYYCNIPGIHTSDSGADWIIILNNEADDAIYDSGEELLRYLEDNTETQINIDVGNAYHDLNKVRESYREAKDAAKYRFSSGEKVIYFRDIYPYYDANASLAYDWGDIHELSNAIRIGNYPHTIKKLDEILEQFKKSGGKRDSALILAMEIFGEIMKICAELKISANIESIKYSSMVGDVFLKETLEEIEEYLKQVVSEVCASIHLEVSDKEKSLVHKVQDAIEEHYSEEISLNTLAQKYFVNASYLSRVFKEKTGSTFTGYLFDVRMKAAENLVLHSELKAYEIAEQVGIADPHYFSSCFKKYTGMSLGEYKKFYL